jgi:two-component system, LuxR family, sensor kinase FixL
MQALQRVLALYSAERRSKVVAASAAGIAVIALADWLVIGNVSLGFLYLFPILLVSGLLDRFEVLLLAALCSLLREAFSSFSWDPGFLARISMVAAAFGSSGLFARELVQNRQRALEHGIELEEEVQRRQESETQLRMVIESTPLAILTVDFDGKIQQANEAAHRLLDSEEQPLKGEPIKGFLPDLDRVPRGGDANQIFRTMMECVGRRRDGTTFMAHVWFSTYSTSVGPWTAAIIVDASEELRDREGKSFESLVTTARILAGSLLHEVRNLSAAATVAHANLMRKPELADDDDLRALGTLVRGLASLSASELRASSDRYAAATDLLNVFSELRVVIEPSFAESAAKIQWDVPEKMPLVRGDHHALLQVFLNLSQNSLRAMRETPKKELTVSAFESNNSVSVRFRDTGSGVAAPDRLFRPFQEDSEGTGLGLYVSRTIVRSLSGDLYYEPQPVGSCFVVRLTSAVT